MSNSREILLKLVRLAVGWECDYTLPETVNWTEILQMAYEQGVLAVSLDGYDILIQNNPNVKVGLASPENKRLLLQAIGQVKGIEARFNRHVAALTELDRLFYDAGIPFLLMKGFACGRYYPNASHRSCGDIDIYPGERYNESNDALKRAGVSVVPYYYRHSASTVKDVLVENHRILGDLRGPKKQTQELEAWLEREAKKSIKEGEAFTLGVKTFEGAKCPSANFNALFLPWHVSAHFAFERVTIRHLLDWALFLKSEGKDIDLVMFKEAKQKFTFGYSKIADILTNLSVRYLNMPIETTPREIVDFALASDSKLADKMMDYMFVGQPRKRDEELWKSRWNNTIRIWKERWKYREVYNISMIRFLIYKGLGVLLRIGEND